MELVRAIADLVAPPLCATCGRACGPEAVLCGRCARRLTVALPLTGAGPPGIDRAWSSAPHQGVARDLVAALKFRRLLPVAELMAARIAELAPTQLRGGTVVAVPPSPARLRSRGFDPAGELAAALAEKLGAELDPALRRRGGNRQVGRRRAERLGSPPRIEATGPAPRSVILVDDVLTTGATLSACAQALRGAGAIRVVALTFARRP